MQKPVMGFPATSQDNYQLNVINILRHGARSFGKQEVVSVRLDGSKLRFTYKDTYNRVKRLGNALTGIGAKVGDPGERQFARNPKRGRRA